MSITATVVLAAAAASYACREIGDTEGRRWFQDEPCAAGYVHDPLPPVPVINGIDERAASFPPPAGSWAATEGSRVYRWRHHYRGDVVVVGGRRGRR